MDIKQRKRVVYVAAILLVLVVAGYNIWSYGSGYCTASSLVAFSAPAKILLAGIAVAIVYLLSCKSKNKQLHCRRTNVCVCGSKLRENWTHCPVCGQQRNKH